MVSVSTRTKDGETAAGTVFIDLFKLMDPEAAELSDTLVLCLGVTGVKVEVAGACIDVCVAPEGDFSVNLANSERKFT